LLALVLGLVVSAGLYFAYLWPAVEPLDEEAAPEPALAKAAAEPSAAEPAPAKAEPAPAPEQAASP
jgi:hypothetical protein